MLLQTIWFFLWGLLWAIYFSLDGHDLGLATLRPFVAKDDTDNRIIYNAMGPLWDGNEVWLITAGGVTFAAFPTTYAIMFSSLYTPLLLILFGLILRGVSFEFRSKIESPAWRTLWDVCQFVGSFGPALLFGVAFANIFQGIPFDDKGVLHGNLFTLLNPYGIVGGIFFVLMFLVTGGLWLIIKSEGPLQARTISLVPKIWIALAAVAVVFLVHTWFATPLYKNYLERPYLFIVPLIAVIALFASRYFMAKEAWWSAWASATILVFAGVWFGVIGLFPNLFPSSLDSAYTLTAFNSSSSQLTLKIMLTVVLMFIPFVVIYQGWVYYLFSDKVTRESLSDESY
jgi:cytochrome bd ubiquinol oxidase subunit II